MYSHTGQQADNDNVPRTEDPESEKVWARRKEWLPFFILPAVLSVLVIYGLSFDLQPGVLLAQLLLGDNITNGIVVTLGQLFFFPPFNRRLMRLNFSLPAKVGLCAVIVAIPAGYLIVTLNT